MNDMAPSKCQPPLSFGFGYVFYGNGEFGMGMRVVLSHLAKYVSLNLKGTF